jgi:feruloyl esterase
MMNVRLSACLGTLASVLVASSSVAATCESLRSIAIPNVTITTAELVTPPAPAAGRGAPGGAARGGGAPAAAVPGAPAARGGAPAGPPAAAQPPLPEYCRLVLVLKPSADSNINSELWLPTKTWNGKFMATGNGGFGGAIQGLNEMRNVIRLGYATAGNDTGHSAADGPNGMFALGHPEKIVDFAYRAMHEMTVTSKKLINEFYGRPQEFAYYKGCSTGGRQGVMNAQRYPEDFDGIIAGALANRHIQMHTAGAARGVHLARHPEQELSAAKAALVNKTVMDSCDTLKEGFLANPRACKVDFKKLACGSGNNAAAESDSCLTAPQLQSVETYYGGLKNSKGELIFSGQALGNPINAQRGNIPAIGAGNDTVRIWGFQNDKYDWSTFDLDRDMPIINSKVGFVDAVDPDLSKFKARGGKLLLYAGWGDTTITPENTVLYYESVLDKMGRNQGDFTRLFLVPGMAHCGGGPGLNTFDSIGALEQWREKGSTPTQVTGFNNTTLMTRPVCAYPQAAKYKGTGNIKDAANWSCSN